MVLVFLKAYLAEGRVRANLAEGPILFPFKVQWPFSLLTQIISVSNEQRVRKEKRILVFHLVAEFIYVTSTLSYGHMEIR